MDNQAALLLIRDILAPRQLSFLEEMVICYSWEGKRYREMALSLGYEEGYVKDTGSRLWQSLSDNLGYPVSKKKLRYILMEIAAQSQTLQASPELAPEPAPEPASKLPSEPATASPASVMDKVAPLEIPLTVVEPSIEYPGSPLSYGSPFYIRRPLVEELAVPVLQNPGGLVRINAPWRMGKTSLINHLVGECQQMGHATVIVDLRQVDLASLESLDAFFRWFCWSINQQLSLPWDIDQYWFEDAGSKLNCTTYVQGHILAQLNSPLVIAVDTCHALMEHPAIARNFFSMLRSWYEQAKVRPQWQKLRLILAHVADLNLPVHAHQSPFNVGLQVELPCLTTQQISDLGDRYSLGAIQHQDAAALSALETLVGGHPYLMQLAFYWLKSGAFSLAQILQTAATNQGIYREYLRGLWVTVQREEGLIKVLHQVLVAPEPVVLAPEQADALMGTGLVEMVGYRVKLRCELYRHYFSDLLELNGGNAWG
ncbi:MAG: AAA-like domain-containing protein [Cyanobacteria bacterium P01_F01_bin.150]